MDGKDEKDICESPPEIIVPQHPDCDPAAAECAQDKRISIDYVPGKCATRGADPHFKKGYELYHAGRLDDALVELDESASIDPGNAETRLLMGDIYEQRRMFDEAIREYEQALKLAPEDKMLKFKLQNAVSQRALLNPADEA